AAGRGRGGVLDRFGVLGRRRAAVPRAARDGRRRGPGAVVAAVHARPHLDLGRSRRAGRRAAGRGGAGAPGRVDQVDPPVVLSPCVFWPPCPVESTPPSPPRARRTPGTR